MAFDLLDIQNDVYKYEASAGVMKEVTVSLFLYFVYFTLYFRPEAESRDRNNDYYIIYNTQIMDGTIFEKQKKYGAHCIIVSGSCYKSKNLKWIKINSPIS